MTAEGLVKECRRILVMLQTAFQDSSIPYINPGRRRPLERRTNIYTTLIIGPLFSRWLQILDIVAPAVGVSHGRSSDDMHVLCMGILGKL